MYGGSRKVAGSLVRQLAPRLSANSTYRTRATGSCEHGFSAGATGFIKGSRSAVPVKTDVEEWVRFSVMGSRKVSTLALSGEHEEEQNGVTKNTTGSAGAQHDGNEKNNSTVSYWGVSPAKLVKEDGTKWKWKSFRPWEAYEPDLSIVLKKHHVPRNFMDKFAYWTVKALRVPTDIFFQRRYGCRAMMLETVAAVPGMVGGMHLHLKSLRRFEHSGGWVKALLEEAENERMHLMTFMEVAKPRWYERALVMAIQGVFFNAYFLV